MKFNADKLRDKIIQDMISSNPDDLNIESCAEGTAIGVIDTFLDMSMDGEVAYVQRRFDDIMMNGYA